jgi:hypothetical protein
VRATFHLEDLGGDLAAALPELAVGPWRYAPAGLVAFDAGEPSAPRWRVDLGRDDAASHHALAGGERSVAETHALLDDMPRRLADALDRVLVARSRSAGPSPPLAPELVATHGESPTWGWLASPDDLGAALTAERASEVRPIAARTRGSTAPPPSGRLASLSERIESPTWGRLARSGAVGASLAPVRAAEARLIAALTGDTASLELEQLAWSAEPAAPAEHEPGRLAQLLDRVADLARGRSRIETRIEGALVAQSVTTLIGDTELWIAPRLSLTGARLHARSAAVAVRTRHAWARILTLTVRGAGRLAVLGLPGGAISAVPVVWRFVRDVLRELRRRDAALRPAV